MLSLGLLLVRRLQRGGKPLANALPRRCDTSVARRHWLRPCTSRQWTLACGASVAAAAAAQPGDVLSRPSLEAAAADLPANAPPRPSPAPIRRPSRLFHLALAEASWERGSLPRPPPQFAKNGGANRRFPRLSCNTAGAWRMRLSRAARSPTPGARPAAEALARRPTLAATPVRPRAVQRSSGAGCQPGNARGCAVDRGLIYLATATTTLARPRPLPVGHGRASCLRPVRGRSRR